MTDERRTSSTSPQQKYRKYTTGDGGAGERAAHAATPRATLAADHLAPSLAAPAAASPPRRRHAVTGGRIVAAGVGLAAMVGLVANMEVANGQSQSAAPAPAPALSAQPIAKDVRPRTAVAPGEVAAAKVKRPIVLTPHTVVNTVSAPSSGGSSSGGSGGGYAYTAPAAPAPAPVARSGGS